MKSVALKFTGKNLSHSVDAFDLATTIIAFGHVLEGIADENFLGKSENKLRLNVTAFKHNCFLTQFDLSLVDAAGIAIVATKTMVDAGASTTLQQIIDTFVDLGKLLKFLKGKRPEKVAIDKSQKVEINHNHGTVNVYQFGENMSVTLPAYRAYQSKTIMGNVRKMKEALEKNPEIDEYDFMEDDKKLLGISKKQAPYFDVNDQAQLTENHRVKGTVTKLDVHTENGYLSIENKGRRIGFNFSKMKDGIEGHNYFKLVESLKYQVPVFLVGTAEFNLESEIQNIEIQNVETDLQLFEPERKREDKGR